MSLDVLVFLFVVGFGGHGPGTLYGLSATLEEAVCFVALAPWNPGFFVASSYFNSFIRSRSVPARNQWLCSVMAAIPQRVAYLYCLMQPVADSLIRVAAQP